MFRLFKKAFFPLVLFLANIPILKGVCPYAFQTYYSVKLLLFEYISNKNEPSLNKGQMFWTPLTQPTTPILFPSNKSLISS